MRVAGTYLLDASVERVWPLIFDPVALVGLIPGCQRMEQVGPNEYRGQIQVGLTGITGIYDVVVRIAEQEEPHFCRLEGEVSSSAGSMKGAASFRLKEEVDHRTLIEYEGNAMLMGALAKFSSRFFEGVAQTMINQGLGKLNAQLQASSAGRPVSGKRGFSLTNFFKRIFTAIQAAFGKRHP
jgi:carbon monoxide dehydrogenase subunit G